MDSFQNNQILTAQLPSIDHIQYEPLENSYKIVALWINSLIFGVLAIGLGIGFIFANTEERKVLAVFLTCILLIYILVLVIVIYGFRQKKYAVRPHDIHYKTGLLWKTHTTIPYNRVQHCELMQGPLDRWYNIAKIKIFTAGGSSSDLTIPGLNPQNAEKIKLFLLNKMSHEAG